jgi:hypothetical protein
MKLGLAFMYICVFIHTVSSHSPWQIPAGQSQPISPAPPLDNLLFLPFYSHNISFFCLL